MFITDLFENVETMNTVVVYPGRFQPWHIGHHEVYKYLVSNFGRDRVFISTSNKVEPPRSPFSFGEKLQFMNFTGIPSDVVVETRDPYRVPELVSRLNANNTRLIFAVSQKDMDEDPRFRFGTKKDGSPTYFQPVPKDAFQMQSLAHHAYILVAPTFEFKVLGKVVKSATDIRTLFASSNEETQKQIIIDLFGRYSPEIHALMKSKIAVTEGRSQLAESQILDLTKNFPNHAQVHAQVVDVLPSGKVKLQIVKADPVPGKKPTLVVGQKLSMALNYLRNVQPVGDVEEGVVVPFKQPLTWQQVPKDVLLLANEWFWASDDDSGLAATLDPKGIGSGTRNAMQYAAAKLQQKGWSIDHNDEYDKPGEYNLRLTNKRGQTVLLPIEDAQEFKGWAQGTSDIFNEQGVAEDVNTGPQIIYATGPRTMGVNDVDLVFKDLRTGKIVAYVVGNNYHPGDDKLQEFAPSGGGNGGGGDDNQPKTANYEIRMGNSKLPTYVAFGDPQQDSKHKVYKLVSGKTNGPTYYGMGMTLVSELDWWSFLEKILGEIMWEDDAIESGLVDRQDNGDLVFVKQQGVAEGFLGNVHTKLKSIVLNVLGKKASATPNDTLAFQRMMSKVTAPVDTSQYARLWQGYKADPNFHVSLPTLQDLENNEKMYLWANSISQFVMNKFPNAPKEALAQAALGLTDYAVREFKQNQDVAEDSDPCWNNYRQFGMKKGKGGKMVPDCRGPMEEGELIHGQFGTGKYYKNPDIDIPMYDPKLGRKWDAAYSGNNPQEKFDRFEVAPAGRTSAHIVGIKNGMKLRISTANAELAKVLVDAYNRGGFTDKHIEKVPLGEENPYKPTYAQAAQVHQQTQRAMQPAGANKFIWKQPRQIGGSFTDQQLAQQGFKKSKFGAWGGTQAMWNRLLGVREEHVLNQPTPSFREIVKKYPNVPLDDLRREIEMGVRTEFEHTKNAKDALEIALDHLNEKPNYYTLLHSLGLE